MTGQYFPALIFLQNLEIEIVIVIFTGMKIVQTILVFLFSAVGDFLKIAPTFCHIFLLQKRTVNIN